MKYIKRFENLKVNDLNLVFDEIINKYSENDIIEILHGEILEWVDSDWENKYESEYEWYVDHNNGEAEDVVIGQLISDYEHKNSIKLDSETYLNLYEKLKKYYNFSY